MKRMISDLKAKKRRKAKKIEEVNVENVDKEFMAEDL